MRLFRPNPPVRIAGLLAGAALLIAACSAASTPSPSAAASTAASASAAASASMAASAGAVVLQAAQSPTVGAYLAGANGMTLYVFKKDSGGKSACTGSCATNWPPLTVSAGATATAGSGVTGTLGTISRDDGSTQVTYDGAPLYYYKGDQKAGDTTGQGVGGIWFVATPSGTPAASASPSASSGGYGYRGYGGAAPAASAAAAANVATIVDFGFQPASLTVKAGTTVTWKNTGSATHTVTADGGSFDSGHLAGGSSFQHTFATAGTFAYHCAIHPSMTATVIVTQ